MPLSTVPGFQARSSEPPCSLMYLAGGSHGSCGSKQSIAIANGLFDFLPSSSSFMPALKTLAGR